MARRERAYMRLTGDAIGLSSRRSLWLGRDHLLLVHNVGYCERYQWFPHANIRAIRVRRTRSYLVLAVVFAAIWAVHGLLAFLFYNWGAGWSFAPVLFAVLAVVAGLGTGIHLAMGPTCRCRIHTAVQTVDLPLRRIRKANRVIRKLAPRIESAQGPMPEDFLARHMERMKETVPPAAPAARPAREDGPPPLPGSRDRESPMRPGVSQQPPVDDGLSGAAALRGAGLPPPVPGDRDDG